MIIKDPATLFTVILKSPSNLFLFAQSLIYTAQNTSMRIHLNLTIMYFLNVYLF